MPCKWCPKEIFWGKGTGGGYVPYEDKARTIIHDCPNNPNKKPPPAMRDQGAAKESVKVEKPVEKIGPATTVMEGKANTPKIPPLTDEEILWIRRFRLVFIKAQQWGQDVERMMH